MIIPPCSIAHFILVVFFSLPPCLLAQGTLQQRLEAFVATQNATIGVSIDIIPDHGPLVHCGVHERDTFIAMSTIKLPLCVLALHLVEQGTLSFKQLVRYDSTDMARNTYSPLRDAHRRPFTLDLRTTIAASVSQSDNLATDKILDAIGGTAVVSSWLREHGFTAMDMGTFYRDMTHDRLRLNWSTPAEMNRLLLDAYRGRLLNKKNTAWLFEQLRRTRTSPDRLKGQLPPGTSVAHKTGTYFTEATLSDLEAVNDVGIIEVQDVGIVVISVFVNHSHMSPKKTEAAIATIGRMSLGELQVTSDK
ncbi:MAG: serine hydrolase [Bacteroidetes bacterium]|nr:serine hydrolase [Bacteroidota bacterium]